LKGLAKETVKQHPKTNLKADKELLLTSALSAKNHQYQTIKIV